MTLDEFHAELINDVHVRVTSVGGFSEVAFTEIASERLEDANEVEDVTLCRFLSADNKIRIDGSAFDEVDESLRLVVTLYFGTAEIRRFGAAEVRQMFSKLQRFVEAALSKHFVDLIDQNHDARLVAEQLLETNHPLSRVRMYLISDGALSSRIKDWPEGDVRGVPIEYHIWDISRFHRAYESATGIDEVEVVFSENGGLPCLMVDNPTAPYQSYLCVISGSELGRIYDEYGARLLEGNVRSFLSAKPKVNQGIRRTLIEQPEMFFAYNNGIAAVASSVETQYINGRKIMTTAVGLQIVNGGQTTASVANVLRNDKDAVLDRSFIPMKLVVVQGEQTSSMIEDISKYANSQNRVSDADFFSNHPYHRRLEQISRRILTPAAAGKQYETRWYYERVRGQYLNEFIKLSSSQKEQLKLVIPKAQLITKIDVARSELSWLMKPNVVSQGAQSFMRVFAETVVPLWRSDADRVNEEYFRNIVSRIILFRRLEQLISQQSWYYSGFRGFVVSYTIARVVFELKNQSLGNVDLSLIWRKQGVDPTTEDQLVAIAALVFNRLTQLPENQKNSSQWVKRLSCWDAISVMEMNLDSAFVGTLISDREANESFKAAKQVQKTDSLIDEQSSVVALGNDFWAAAIEWASGRSALSSSDLTSLRAAAGLFGSLPTPKQCRRVLQLRTLFESQGFIFNYAHEHR